MTADEVLRLTQHIDGLWPDSTATDVLKLEFGRRIKPLAIPYQRACEVVGEVRWRAKYRSPDYPTIAEALSLETRKIAANVSRQNAALSANRAALNETPEDVEAEHRAAREFVRNLPQADLIRLRDRCLSRQSKFVRMLVSGGTPDGVKPDESTAALDWANRDTILSRLWVCMGLHMEHNGFNDWSPIDHPATAGGGG